MVTGPMPRKPNAMRPKAKHRRSAASSRGGAGVTPRTRCPSAPRWRMPIQNALKCRREPGEDRSARRAASRERHHLAHVGRLGGGEHLTSSGMNCARQRAAGDDQDSFHHRDERRPDWDEHVAGTKVTAMETKASQPGPTR